MPHTARHSPRPISANFGRTVQQSAVPEPLFVYGSLLFPDVLQVLLDRVPESVPVSAEGWRVAEIPDAVFPALVKGSSIATGQLLLGLTEDDWRTIDAFEDPLYELKEISLTNGSFGWAYVCTDSTAVSQRNWDRERFKQQHLESYVRNCLAWRTAYERKRDRHTRRAD